MGEAEPNEDDGSSQQRETARDTHVYRYLEPAQPLFEGEPGVLVGRRFGNIEKPRKNR